MYACSCLSANEKYQISPAYNDGRSDSIKVVFFIFVLFSFPEYRKTHHLRFAPYDFLAFISPCTHVYVCMCPCLHVCAKMYAWTHTHRNTQI